jgi:hypothetical protein
MKGPALTVLRTRRIAGKETVMKFHAAKVACMLLCGLFAPFISPSRAQQSAAAIPVVQVTGMTGFPNKTKGNITLKEGNLEFATSKSKAVVPITSLQDVVTGNDSQRVFRGTFGTLTMFAPYGSGRFLSLFRSKLDTITIQYLDADGALHGTIFTMPVGKADSLKKDLMAQGAHTTIPPDDPKTPEAKSQENKEKQ